MAHEDELGLRLNELFDEPRAGNAIHFHFFDSDPFHAVGNLPRKNAGDNLTAMKPRLSISQAVSIISMLWTISVAHAALKALGEESRLRTLRLLFKEQLGVNEISKRLRLSQYNVSKHLRIMREAVLLEVEKQGKQRLFPRSNCPQTKNVEHETGQPLAKKWWNKFLPAV